jgi:hypothetical protein
MNRVSLAGWVRGYERAWRTPDEVLDAALRDLFRDDATYRTAPFEQPFTGLPAITEMWRTGRDGPDEVFSMTFDVVAVDGDVGVVRLEVRYGEPVRQHYRDLWLLRFDAQERCTAFEEWPFWPRGAEGGYHPGPSAPPGSPPALRPPEADGCARARSTAAGDPGTGAG